MGPDDLEPTADEGDLADEETEPWTEDEESIVPDAERPVPVDDEDE